MERGILLWGGKSQARIIEAMLKEAGYGDVTIIFDNTIENTPFITKAKFMNCISDLKKSINSVSRYVVCIGAEHGYARYNTAIYLERCGLRPITLVHESSFIDPSAKLGEGCQVMPRAVVHKFTEIGPHCIINTNATIDHECIIGKGVHVMGGASVTGKIEVGDFATIGSNATILPFVKIGEGAFIGAGSLVKEDVEPYTLHVGNPGRFLRQIEPKFYKDLLVQLCS